MQILVQSRRNEDAATARRVLHATSCRCLFLRQPQRREFRSVAPVLIAAMAWRFPVSPPSGGEGHMMKKGAFLKSSTILAGARAAGHPHPGPAPNPQEPAPGVC